MTPAGDLQFSDDADVKEKLIAELHAQTTKAGIVPTVARVERVVRKSGIFQLVVPSGDDIYAHRVVVGIGRSGNFRKLGVPGEELEQVYARINEMEKVELEDPRFRVVDQFLYPFTAGALLFLLQLLLEFGWIRRLP